MDPVIEIKKMSRVYGEGDIQVRALDEVDLSIGRGEFTAIVGPSGSGKSTLLNLVGGLDTPSSGNILLAGKSIEKMTEKEISNFRRDSIGFIFQSYNLIPVLTAAENVEYVLLLQGKSKKERQNRVSQILSRVGLEGFEKRRPAQLSGGQQQRVAVARAMVARPHLILADEPTANLDSSTGSSLLKMMRELNEMEGMTFVFSTHDPMIMERAKRLIHLKDGKVVSDEKKP